jgi:hypothetical protein
MEDFHPIVKGSQGLDYVVRCALVRSLVGNKVPVKDLQGWFASKKNFPPFGTAIAAIRNLADYFPVWSGFMCDRSVFFCPESQESKTKPDPIGVSVDSPAIHPHRMSYVELNQKCSRCKKEGTKRFKWGCLVCAYSMCFECFAYSCGVQGIRSQVKDGVAHLRSPILDKLQAREDELASVKSELAKVKLQLFKLLITPKADCFCLLDWGDLS